MARKQKLLSQSIGHLRVIEQEAVKIAKDYLRQFKDWQLVMLRLDDKNLELPTRRSRSTLKPCLSYKNIIKAVSKDDQASGIILDQRFIHQKNTDGADRQALQYYRGQLLSSPT